MSLARFYVTGQTKKRVRLTEKDFLAAGGEKRVFVHDTEAYCLYHDFDKAMPEGKIAELAKIADKRVVRPTESLYDDLKRHVGEVMPFVSDAVVLVQLFGRKFCRVNGVTNAHREKFTRAMCEVMAACHAANVLMVDPNECNWLVKADLSDVYAVDSACYKTPSFPALAIKAAVRDYQKTSLDEGTDWYSLAVIVAYLWLGMHPYDGLHPDFDKTPTALIERMRKMVSCFDSRAQLNANCQSPDQIPKHLRDWLRGMLSTAKREKPPKHFGAAGVVQVAVPIPLVGGDVILDFFTLLAEEPTALYGDHFVTDGTSVVCVLNSTTYPEVKFTFRNGIVRAERLSDGQPVAGEVEASAMFEANGELYVVQRDRLVHVKVNVLPKTPELYRREVAVLSTNPRQIKTFPGVLFQTLSAATYATMMPTEELRYTRNLAELAGHQILSAKSERTALVVHTKRSSKFYQHVYCWDSDFEEYDYHVEELPRYMEVAFAIAKGKILVLLSGDAKLFVRAVGKQNSSPNVRWVADKQLTEDSGLYTSSRGEVLVNRGCEIYRMRLRS